MDTKNVPANNIKVGSFILIEGVCCKVVDTATSKSGKHGHAKCRIVAVSLVGNKKKDIVMGSQSSVEVPIIEKRNAQVMSVSGDTANVMDQETYETLDLPIPEELSGQVKEGSLVLYWVIGDDKVIKQVREGN
ncbi:translation initiation factor IF-5A [Candidatus Woesearchaeota archaeon]|nr:translation initiation factor IF-5A [Candidatus Woesearchaeota archaeon]|tara:strand:- start:569 stop:967 length:399 start_codon:yes stop_codon:yes gene_type:complete